MQFLADRSCIKTCLFIAFLMVAVLVWLDRFGAENRVSGKTGIITTHDIVRKVVDDFGEAYRIWKQAGYRGRTIVFVSDRWESFDPGELIPAQMFRAYPLQLYNTARLLEDEHLNGVTFLYVAAKNKICRRIMAIVPESEVSRMKEAARKAKDAKISDDNVFISREGFPRHFSTAASFKSVNEPVLIYVGASYFRTAEPEDLYRQLVSAGQQTDGVILCNEKGNTTVTTRETAKLNTFARLIGIIPAAERVPSLP